MFLQWNDHQWIIRVVQDKQDKLKTEYGRLEERDGTEEIGLGEDKAK